MSNAKGDNDSDFSSASKELSRQPWIALFLNRATPDSHTMKMIKTIPIGLGLLAWILPCNLSALSVEDLHQKGFRERARLEIQSSNQNLFDPQGWSKNEKYLHHLITQIQPEIVVEVGTWKGKSAWQMSKVLPPNGTIYCVDTWLGSTVHQKPKHPHFSDLSKLYETFLSNCKNWGLENVIVPVRGDSVQIALHFPFQADLIYIDGDHAEASVYADLVAWSVCLKDPTAMCGDDWPMTGVRKAVIRFAKQKKLTIFYSNRFWSFSPFPEHKVF